MRLQMACLYRLVVEIEDYQSDGVAVNWVVGMSGGPKLPVLDFLACLTTVCPKILGASRPTIELLLFSGVFFFTNLAFRADRGDVALQATVCLQLIMFQIILRLFTGR